MVAAQIDRVHPFRARRLHQTHQPVHQVFDPAESADLFAVAVYRYVAVLERSGDHLHHDALIQQIGPRAVGVEYAGYAGVDVVFGAIGPVERFGGGFSFAEHAMALGGFLAFAAAGVCCIAEVARRAEKDAGMFRACCFQRVDRSQHAYLERFHGQRLVVAHPRGRGHVVDFVAADAERIDNVVTDEAESRMLPGVAQQRRRIRIADVDTIYFVSRFQQTQAQMRAYESRTSQYDDSFLHLLLLFFGAGGAKSIP